MLRIHIRLAAVVMATASVAMAAWPTEYEIVPLGFADAAHTSPLGFQQSQLTGTNSAGAAIGLSSRFGTVANMWEGWGGWNSWGVVGTTAWIWENGRLQQIGFDSGIYLSPAGSIRSTPIAMNAASQVIGTSTQYAGSSTGLTAWLWDGGTTTAIGLTGAEYTDANGLQASTPSAINAAGQVIGESSRYNAPGRAAWIYGNGQTTRIGLVDGRYTSLQGLQRAKVTSLNDAGQVLGYSDLFQVNSDSSSATTAWLYSGGTTTALGLTDAVHTNSAGDRSSYPRFLNSAGDVVGTSTRYSGTASKGTTSWLYRDGGYQELGLKGSAYVSSAGVASTSTKALNSSGDMAGTTEAYSGTLSLRSDCWSYKNGVTTRIGVVDSEHAIGGDIRFLTESGLVAGYSYRKSQFAQTPWIYQDGTLTRLDDADAKYLTSGGDHTGNISAADPTGRYVVGKSTLFGLPSRDGNVGESGWVYDTQLKTKTYLNFGQQADGYAYVYPTWTHSDGVVGGTYSRYSRTTYLGASDFYWSAADGLFDLGDASSQASPGWSSVSVGMGSDNWGFGSGTRNGVSTAILATPVSRWTATSGGAWSIGTSWSQAVTPRAMDLVTFSQDARYSVSFQGDVSARAVNVVRGDVTWNLGGHDMRVGQMLRIGDEVGGSAAALHVNDGRVIAEGEGITIYNHARLMGNGSLVGAVVSHGTIAPGNSPGTLTIDGDLTTDGLVELEAASATSIDKLVVTGDLVLEGEVRISLLDGYTPVAGTVLDFVDVGGTLIAQNYTLTLPELSYGLGWDSSQFASTGSIAVIAVPEPLALGTMALIGLTSLLRPSRHHRQWRRRQDGTMRTAMPHD